MIKDNNNEVMGSIPACVVCPVRKKYKEEVYAFNKLVTTHNALIEDSNALLRFLEDLAKGIRVTLCEGKVLSPDMFNEVKLMVKPAILLDPFKSFLYDYHNEIAGFILELKEGKRAREVYAAWIQKCISSYKNN
jgi:hypothetical protein